MIYFIILFDIKELNKLWKTTFKTVHQLSCLVGHPVPSYLSRVISWIALSGYWWLMLLQWRCWEVNCLHYIFLITGSKCFLDLLKIFLNLNLRIWIWESESKNLNLRIWIWESESENLNLRIWIWESESENLNLRIYIWESESENLNLRIWIWGSESENLNLRIWIWESESEDLNLRIWIWESESEDKLFIYSGKPIYQYNVNNILVKFSLVSSLKCKQKEAVKISKVKNIFMF